MSPERLRSIVPMFGGATKYVETLDALLAFVDSHNPTTDELVGWHRGSFERVSSQESIMRRVTYLRRVGFVQQEKDNWMLGGAGRKYRSQNNIETLLEIMCARNVGLRSLMYALSVGSMTLAEVSDQQLDTHPELGWSRGETDMALQRVNWLRSMGLVKKQDGKYALTEEGWQFVETAVEDWAGADSEKPGADEEFSANTYETTVRARSIDPEFRQTVVSRHDRTCPVSGIDHPKLLDVAHVLPWSEYPEYRADLTNVLPLSKTHHAAFDRELFTIDQEYRLRVNPSFETQSDLLQQTIINQAGERIPVPDASLNPEYLTKHNATLAWV